MIKACMPLKRKEYPDFIYFWYHRQEFRDSVSLKRELSDVMLHHSETRDIVIDFAACNGLISSEISVLVRLISLLNGSPRFVRIIVNPKVRIAIQAVNLQKLQNFVVYDDQKKFIEAVKGAGASSAEHFSCHK
jgi:hypothetical protein